MAVAIHSHLSRSPFPHLLSSSRVAVTSASLLLLYSRSAPLQPPPSDSELQVSLIVGSVGGT